MSTPINSIIFPGSPEKYLLRDHRATTSESGAANINEFGFIKVGYQGNTQNVPVTLDENGNAYVELSNTINSLPTSDVSYLQGNNRWLIFDFSNENRRGLKVKKGTKVKLTIKSNDPEIEDEIRWLNAEEDLHYDFSDAIENFDTLYGANGTDFYVYLVPDENNGVDLVISMDSEYPSDVENENVTYTANNTRKIGQFHTLCVDVGDNVTGIVSVTKTSGNIVLQSYVNDNDFVDFYTKSILNVVSGTEYNTATIDHPLSGFKAGDILPESVWCLNFHPKCKNWDGMVYCNSSNIAVDIYLQSGTGENTRSEYGALATINRHIANHIADMHEMNKREPFYSEFISFASCSNEKSVSYYFYSYTGGHVDFNGRRMISAIGCEDCCGYLWQITNTIHEEELNDWHIYDGDGSFGMAYDKYKSMCVGLSYVSEEIADQHPEYILASGSRSIRDPFDWAVSESSLGNRGVADIAVV